MCSVCVDEQIEKRVRSFYLATIREHEVSRLLKTNERVLMLVRLDIHE
jgi:hypothetical protein